MAGMPADLSCSNRRPRISQQCTLNPDSTTRSERPAGQAADYRGAGGMKKDKELGASTDAGEVGTLAVSLPGLATRRVARTTVSPSAAPGLTDGSNMAKAVVTRGVALVADKKCTAVL